MKTEATKYNIILTFVLMIQKCSSFSSMQYHGVHATSVLVPRASRQLGFPGKTIAASIACKIGVPRSSSNKIKLNTIKRFQRKGYFLLPFFLTPAIVFIVFVQKLPHALLWHQKSYRPRRSTFRPNWVHKGILVPFSFVREHYWRFDFRKSAKDLASRGLSKMRSPPKFFRRSV